MFSSLGSLTMPDSKPVDPSSSHPLPRSILESIADDRATILETDTDRATKDSPEEAPMELEENDTLLLWAGSPHRRMGHIPHLPTPQSPSNIGVYVDTIGLQIDSPTRSSSRESRTSMVGNNQQSLTLHPGATSASLMTPESSPLFVRRPKSSVASSSSSLPSTPTRKNLSFSLGAMTVPSRPSTPLSSHSPNISIPSVLSSPFTDLQERHLTSRDFSMHSPNSDMVDIDSLHTSLPVTPLPLSAPVPQRAVGGEITRLRLQMAAEQAALAEETESRRPDYLKRTKRPLSDWEDNADDQENTAANLGVMDSPVKGRRIALFQETSEESFEQSLLAGGYPSYGLTPAYDEPSTPQTNEKRALSQRAVDWLQQATPGQQMSPQTPGVKDESESVEDEQELRKRRRLSAFNGSASRPKLFPVEVEGHGRVLIDQPPADLPLQPPETPSKKRSNNRRKRGGTQDSPSRKRAHLSDLLRDADPERPNWPDHSFPWSMRAHERQELLQREHNQKLKRIARYLDRESDEDDDEDQSLGLPVEDFVEPRLKRGRGKMVPLPTNPGERRQSMSRRNSRYFPSDPADARAALLSKRSVRALAFRRQQENEVVCVCRGKDDGRELVQCDECKEWFHLDCIGIKDISELGREEDPWYCMDCLGVPPARPSSPTFAPTDDRPTGKPRRDPLFFQAITPRAISWHTPDEPKTPIRDKELIPQLSSRSPWGDSSSPVGPQTPLVHHNSRAYITPKISAPLDESFDPLSTPSRGMHFSGPFTTPTPSTFWGARASALQTPSRPTKKVTAPWAYETPQDRGELRPYRPEYDESPIRRSQPRPDKRLAAVRNLPG